MGYMDMGVEEGRAEMVTVEVIPSDNDDDNEFYEIVDAFTLLEEIIPTEEDYVKEALKTLEPLLRGIKDAVLIDYSNDNRICYWDEGTYYPSAQVLVFEYSGQRYSLVRAGM